MRYKGVSVVYPRDMLKSHVEKYVDEVLRTHYFSNISAVEIYYNPASDNEVVAYLYSKPDGYTTMTKIDKYPAKTRVVSSEDY